MNIYTTWSEKAYCYDAEHVNGGTVLYYECLTTGNKKEITHHDMLLLSAYTNRTGPLIEVSDKLICKCGYIIPFENIDHNNGCNEEGEDYGTVSANCDTCNKEYETSTWGEWDNLEHAVNYLQQYINKN